VSAIIDLTDQSFDAEVVRADAPVLVDFWAPWCGPCRVMEPVLDELAERGVKVAKLNVDEHQQTAARFSVLSIPTLMVFERGEVRKKVIGAIPRARLLSELGHWLGDPAPGPAG
jgi:thioredoxin 1